MTNDNGNDIATLRDGITERINIRRVLPYCWLLSTYPSEDSFDPRAVSEVFSSFLPHVIFLHLFIWGIKVELFRHSFFLFVHGRAVLAMEGKSVLPVHSAVLSEQEEV